MFCIDVGQRLTFSDQRRYQCIQGNQICTVYLRLASCLCVAAFGNSVCLLRNVVDSVQFALSPLGTYIAYIRRFFQLFTGTILKGAAHPLAVYFQAGAAYTKAVGFFAQPLPPASSGVTADFSVWMFTGCFCSISPDLFRYMAPTFVDRLCNLCQILSGVDSCLYGNSVR